jgi:putative Mg2+ transporter-C (MgtC) family protein
MIEVILKLVLAVVFGGIIGLEREFSQKPAGLRTNILICIGATMMMALSGIMLGGAASGSADALRRSE